MSFATRLATALAEENPAFYTEVSEDFTNFQTSLDAELVTYGASSRVRNWLEDRILQLAVEVADQMAGITPQITGGLLSETGLLLLSESGLILQME